MKKAIILYGPSGVGKSTLARQLVKDGFVHCDADACKKLFSSKRSKERSEIGEKICYEFTREVAARGHNLIVEALPDLYVVPLKDELAQKKYTIYEISLIAPLEICMQHDAQRSGRSIGSAVITEVYRKYTKERGLILSTASLNLEEMIKSVKKYIY